MVDDANTNTKKLKSTICQRSVESPLVTSVGVQLPAPCLRSIDGPIVRIPRMGETPRLRGGATLPPPHLHTCAPPRASSSFESLRPWVEPMSLVSLWSVSLVLLGTRVLAIANPWFICTRLALASLLTRIFVHTASRPFLHTSHGAVQCLSACGIS